MRKVSLVVALVAMFVFVCVLSFVTGENGVSVSSLFDADFWATDSAQLTILRSIRLPRTLMAIACGMLLSLSGVMMQGLFRNPLVEPYTMGLSGGALLGVSLVVSLGWVDLLGGWLISLAAAVGALLVMFLVLAVRGCSYRGTDAMLLIGVMISFITSSLNMLIMSVLSHENLSRIVGWSMGALDVVAISHSVVLAVLAVLFVVVSPLLGNLLNVISLGDAVAGHLGVDVRKATGSLFVVSTIIASLCVSEVGVVAFVGLVVPHVVRRFVGVDYRVLLPVSGVVGGSYLLLCDVLAREVVYPRELPAGVFCGVLGGLFFIVLLSKSGKYGKY